MAIETFAFDPAAFLTSDEERAAYLSEALATNDATFVADAVAVLARSRGAEVSSRSELSDVLESVRALGLKLTAAPAD